VRLSHRAIVVLSALTLTLTSAAATYAEELLQNGGFEAGANGWNGIGISTGCTPNSGSDALEISSTGTVAFAQQNVDGSLYDGAYSLSGWLMVTSGAPEISVRLLWLDGDGSEVDRTSDAFSGGASYESFSLNSTRPSSAESIRIRIAVEGPSASVCLDDVSLEGPAGSATDRHSQPHTSTLGNSPHPHAHAQPNSNVQSQLNAKTDLHGEAVFDPKAHIDSQGCRHVQGGGNRGSGLGHNVELHKRRLRAGT
jgi:hypothetical protein